MDISSMSAYSDYYSQLAGNSDSKALSNRINNISNSVNKETSDDDLMKVCKEFESYLLEQVFKNMEKTIMRDEEKDQSSSQLVDFFKDRTLQELTGQATEQNSTGLAQILYEQLKRNMGVTADKLTKTAAQDVSETES